MVRHTLETDGHISDEPPDAGLAQIAAGFAARAAVAAAPGSTGEGQRVTRHLATADDVWTLELPPGTLSAAGTIDPVDWGPPTGSAWRITGMSIVLGAGTSLVQVYKETNQVQNLRFQTSASGLWEPSHLYVLYGSRLVVVSTGGGVTIAPWGERIALGFLPTYLA